MSTTIVRAAPAVTRNGLLVKPYIYRGTGQDTLTPFLDEPESRFEALPRVGRQLAAHGTAGAARRHYRHGTPLCDSCRQYESRRHRDEPRRPHLTHADRGDGRPRCGVWNISDPLIAAPGEDVMCTRCNPAGRTA